MKYLFYLLFVVFALSSYEPSLAASLSSHSSFQKQETSLTPLHHKKWNKKYPPQNKKKTSRKSEWLYILAILALLGFSIWGIVLGALFLGLAWYWWVLGVLLSAGLLVGLFALFSKSKSQNVAFSGYMLIAIAGALVYFLAKNALLQMIGLGVWAFMGITSIWVFLFFILLIGLLFRAFRKE